MNNIQGLGILILASMIITILSPLIIGYSIFYTICSAVLFYKMREKFWKALIPYYKNYTLIKIAGLNWWYTLISISDIILIFVKNSKLPLIIYTAKLIVNFFVFYNIGKKMNKKPIVIAFSGAFVPIIMVPILALSKKFQYDNTVAVSPNGPIGKEKNPPNNNTATPERFCINCGQKLYQDASFCENCGKKID